MTSRRTLAALAWLFTIAPAFAGAQEAPTVKVMLGLSPVLKGVEYEIPSEPAAISACKIETVYNARRRPSATPYVTDRGSCSAGSSTPTRRAGWTSGAIIRMALRSIGKAIRTATAVPTSAAGSTLPARGSPAFTGQDHRLGANLGRGGVEGLRPGPGHR